MRRVRQAAIVLSTVLLSGAARAEPMPPQRSLAEGLFDEGRQLMMDDRYEEACPKLAESQRLDPGGGTLLNLALCHERLGRTATAWTEFREALAYARRDNRPDREKIALEHAESLEALLPRLRLTVHDPSTELELLIDGVEVGAEARNSAVPLDPGEHLIEARAPGKRAFSASVTLNAEQVSVLEIPVLEPAPAAPAPTKVSVPAPPPIEKKVEQEIVATSSTARTIGYVVAGLGVAALGVGGYFGVRALSEDSSSDELCNSEDCTSEPGVRHSENARDSALIANVAFGVGAVALGAGTFLILTSDVGSPKRAQKQSRAEYTLNASLLATW